MTVLEKLKRHWPAIRAKLFPFLVREIEKRKHKP